MKDRIKAIGRLLIGKGLTPDEAFLRGLPIDSFGTSSFPIHQAYENSAVAYACIRRIAVDAGNAPFLILNDKDDLESTVPEDHPLSLLFSQPNPWFETNQFFEYLYTLLNLRGEFFIKIDNPNQPRELIQYYDPRYWKERVTSDMRLAGWDYNHMTVAFPALPSDVIHHKFTNVSNPFRGQSPMQAAASSVWTEIDGDNLTADIMGRGGEQGLVYTVDEKLLPTQEEELQASLRARRTFKARVPNDVLLTGGMTILDPKFTGFDYKLFDRMGPAEQKIIQVYGLSPSLIGRDDEPNFATFMGRLRIYWRQTLLPMMTAVESTFDEFLKPFGLYFRYDRSNIAGLQEDLKELAQIALILNKGGIPWTVINDRLQMGLEPNDIPGSDDVMVQGSMVPLSRLLDEYDNPPEPTAEPQDETDEAEDGQEEDENLDKGLKHPAYEVLLARSKDISTLIVRNRKLAGLERAVASSWRSLALDYKKSAVAEMETALAQNHTAEGAVAQFRNKFSDSMNIDFPKDAVEKVMPRAIQAIGEGEVSIEQLVKRLTTDEIKQFSKAPGDLLSPRSLDYIKNRQNLVKDMGPKLWKKLMAALMELITDEGEVGEMAERIRAMVSSTFNASVNRAVTIARTEIGTAYNVGRYNNMQEQGYAHHEWLTNIDEFTRDETDEFDHVACDGEIRIVGELFPNGLAYPQEPGGDAGNVINCRCSTIPLTQEQYDERTS